MPKRPGNNVVNWAQNASASAAFHFSACVYGCADVSVPVCVLSAAIVNKYAYHKMRTTKSDYVRNCAPHEGHAQYLHKGENLNAAG